MIWRNIVRLVLGGVAIYNAITRPDFTSGVLFGIIAVWFGLSVVEWWASKSMREQGRIYLTRDFVRTRTVNYTYRYGRPVTIRRKLMRVWCLQLRWPLVSTYVTERDS